MIIVVYYRKFRLCERCILSSLSILKTTHSYFMSTCIYIDVFLVVGNLMMVPFCTDDLNEMFFFLETFNE